MQDLRGDGFHDAAFRSWIDTFVSDGNSWAPLELDGEKWDIAEALSDERLEMMLRSTPVKAVGADVLDDTWLRRLDVPPKFKQLSFSGLRACARWSGPSWQSSIRSGLSPCKKPALIRESFPSDARSRSSVLRRNLSARLPWRQSMMSYRATFRPSS